MPSILFTNNAATTLASGITNVATSLTVAAGKGALFPTISGSDFFYATLANGSGGVEIVKVTARSTDTFTIVRGQDNTSAVAWNTGDKVELRVTAAALGAMAQTANLPSTYVTSNVAGTGISVSGATGAVTVTNTGVTSNVAGTGIGVSGATGAVTVTNNGVTSVTAGTGISVSASTGGITITNTAPNVGSGTVTSVATGNGLSGGTITTTGTLAIAAPATQSVGSYAAVELSTTITSPTTFSLGTTCAGSFLRVWNSVKLLDSCGVFYWSHGASTVLSGTWMYLGPLNLGQYAYQMLFVRTA